MLSIFPAGGRGEDEVVTISSVDDLDTLLITANPELQAVKLEGDAVKGDRITAALRPNPVLSLNSDIFPAPGEKFDPKNKQYGAYLQVPVEYGGKRDRRIEKSNFEVEIAKHAYADVVRQTLLSARNEYWDALLSRDLLELAQENALIFKQLVDLNEARFKARIISGAELSRSRVAMSQAELQVNEARLGYSQARESLARAIGKKCAVVLAEKLAPVEYAPEGLAGMIRKGFALRPDLAAARLVHKTALANLNLQNANALPELTVGMDYTQSGYEQFYGLSAQIALPVFDRNQGERLKAEAQVRQAEKRIEMASVIVTSEIKSAYQEIETRNASLKKFLSGDSDTILRQAGIIKTSATFAYKSKSISLMEYLDAIRTYGETYRSYVEEIAKFNKSVSLLVAAAGLDPGKKR